MLQLLDVLELPMADLGLGHHDRHDIVGADAHPRVQRVAHSRGRGREARTDRRKGEGRTHHPKPDNGDTAA